MNKKLGEIVAITRQRKNGMYVDEYTVTYANGNNKEWKTYRINGSMIKKHFDFMMNAKCIPMYNLKTGNHFADRFEI